MASTIICIHVPRMQLLAGACSQHPAEGPLALAPAPGSSQALGEVSPSAEALGVRAGMALGEALARVPELQLLSPDPDGAARAWEQMVGALEATGARLELEQTGTGYLQADSLYRLHGSLDGVFAALRTELGRLVRSTGSNRQAALISAAGARVRLGAGPSRFYALLACRRSRGRRALAILPAGRGIEGSQSCYLLKGTLAERYIASLPIELLAVHRPVAALVEPLQRLGIITFGELSALGRAALSDRFGRPGLLAWDLVAGRERPLKARCIQEHLEESIELEGSLTGQGLERAAGILLDRLLAHPQRRGRALRVLVLAAELAGGGTWQQRIALRQATAEHDRMMRACSLRLQLLPAPARRLSLRAESLAEVPGEQLALLGDDRDERARRLREATSQVRAGAGAQALLRIVPLEESSRAFERRFLLTPRS